MIAAHAVHWPRGLQFPAISTAGEGFGSLPPLYPRADQRRRTPLMSTAEQKGADHG